MAGRVGILARQLLAQPCSEPGAAAADPWLESPTGRVYSDGTSRTLMGNMEPAVAEVEGPLVLVHGTLPRDIDGQFIRNGPNPILNMEGKPYHEFTGDAMLHASDLKGGVGTYRNRWVRTERVEQEGKLGRPLSQMETMADGRHRGAANTSLVYHAKRLLALYEADKPYVISVPELETLGQFDYEGKFDHAMTAHPKVCPKTGELIFFNSETMQPVVHYGVADRDGNLLRKMTVPTQGKLPVLMHDMAITENYSLLLEFPLYFNIKMAMKGKMPYVHDTKAPSRFGIFPRHSENPEVIRWFEAESAMTFHTANAWEEGPKIKLVGCPQKHFSFEYEKSAPSLLHEWTFDLQTGKTTERQLDDTKVEFPVVHPRVLGSQGRYVWTAIFTEAPSPFHGICGCMKYDLSTGRRLRHDFMGGRRGGECVFAPKSQVDSSDEDDGYLVTYTFNPEDKTTELYIVDARTMDPNPVAILRTPQRVPFGFHGTWLPRAEL